MLAGTNRFFLYAFGCLFLLIAFSGCGTRRESKWLSEEEVREARQKIELVKLTVGDPIYDVADAACHYRREFGHWPAVEHLPVSTGRFETYSPTIRNNDTYEASFQLNTYPATWTLVLQMAGDGNASQACLLTLSSSVPDNDRSPENVSKPFSNRVITGTVGDRYQFVPPLMFTFPIVAKHGIGQPPITSTDKITQVVAESVINIVICTISKSESCRPPPIPPSVHRAQLNGGLGMHEHASKKQSPPSCHLHRTRDVSFRTNDSKDVLEISIGDGPCNRATLAIVVRTEEGEVLYSYIAPFLRHTASSDENLSKIAETFVDRTITNAMQSTTNLPPFLESEAYYEKHNGVIIVARTEYEKLRRKARPMLYHLNYYEGWQYIVYDEKTNKSQIILEGGL